MSKRYFPFSCSIISFSCLLFSLSSSAGTADGTSDTLDVTPRTIRSGDILELTMAHNSTLRNAVLAQRKANQSILAAEGLYPFVVEADAGYTRSSAGLGDSRYRNQNSTTLGAGLSKTFSTGTAANFRLQGEWSLAEGTTRTDSLVGETTSGNDPNYGLSARLTLTQPLLRGYGKEVGLATYRQAVIEKSLAEKSRDAAAGNTARSVLSAYWNLWLAAKTVEINARSRDVANEQLAETEQRVEAGDVAPVNRLSFQTRVASLEETVMESEATVRQMGVALAREAGVIDRYPMLLADTDESLPEVRELPPYTALVRQALKESPAIQSAFVEVTLAEEKMRVSGESLRQRLDLQGWIEARTRAVDEVSPVMTDLQYGGAYAGYIGIAWEMPLNDQRKNAERAKARINLEMAVNNLQTAENTLRAEIATALDKFTSARARLSMAEETQSLANQQAEAERERYRLGAAIFTTVRDAEETVREAALRLTRAQVDAVQAKIEIDNLTGTLPGKL